MYLKKGDDGINPKEDYNEIISQLIGYIYLEAINKLDIGFNEKGIYLNSLKGWKESIDIKKNIKHETSGLSINTLMKILDDAERHLYNIVDNNYIDEIKLIWEEILFDTFITHLLLFNSFTIQSSMPGEIITHNADSTDNNNLFWNVDINNFLNDDFELYAYSRIIHKDKILYSVFLVLLIGIFVFRRFLKK